MRRKAIIAILALILAVVFISALYPRYLGLPELLFLFALFLFMAVPVAVIVLIVWLVNKKKG